MLSTMTICRRTHLRIPTSASIDWRTRDACTHIVSTLRDWSRDGVFIQTAVPRQPGDMLTLDMNVEGTVMQLEGIVVRRSPDGMGVRLDTTCARFR